MAMAEATILMKQVSIKLSNLENDQGKTQTIWPVVV